jgi:hypothetical protein
LDNSHSLDIFLKEREKFFSPFPPNGINVLTCRSSKIVKL